MASNDLYSVAVLGDRALLRNIEQLPDAVQEILYAKIVMWTQQLHQSIYDNINDRLSSKTGRLAQSVDSDVVSEDGTVKGFVTIDTPYAKIQDVGGTTASHIIRPKNARVLRFIMDGKKAFARYVFHPGGHIPGTRFSKDVYLAISKIIGTEAKKTIIAGIREHMRTGA